MAKCIDCAWFPWVPGADFSNLPAQRCHPALKMRRWTQYSASIKHNCQHYKPKEKILKENRLKKEPADNIDVKQMTVAELKKFLAATEDLNVIEALKVQEESSDNPRVTALEAIESRLRELREGEA